MKRTFGFTPIGFGRNVIIFIVDISSSAHIDYNKKGPMQELEHTLTAEKLYSINFTEHIKKFCWSLHYNRANNYLFVNGTEIVKFKAKDCSNSIVSRKHFKKVSVDDMKKTGFYGYVYGFSGDYDAIAVYDILDIHKYLMKQHNIK